MNRRELLTIFMPGSGAVIVARRRGDLTELSQVEKMAVAKDVLLLTPTPAILAACQTRNPGTRQRAQDGAVDRQLQEYGAKEKELEPVIAKFEEGFARFNDEALRRLAPSGTTPQERSILLNPFEIARINRGNPDRNAYTWRRKHLESIRKLSSVRTTISNPNFFFFDFQEEGLGVAASFVPSTRTLYITKQYNPNNLLDNSIVMHELIHVAQDNQDREEIPPTVHEAFHSTPGYSGSTVKAIGLYEASAFAAQIYMLNQFTDGEFRSDVLRGEGLVDIDKYRERLNARPEQNATIKRLAEVAYQYYTILPSLTGIHEQFLNYITRMYRAQGADIYMRVPGGYAPVR